MIESYAFSSQEMAEKILGANDKNLSYIELLLGSELSLKGNIVTSNTEGSVFIPLFKRLEHDAEIKGSLSEAEIFMTYEDIKDNYTGPISSIQVLQKSVWPKSAMQRRYMNALFESEVVFASGPAGTGKTFLAIAYALAEVLNGK